MTTREQWRVVSIKDVCEAIVDCVNKTAPTVEHETPYKMIRTSNVKGGWIDLDDVKFVEADVFAKWNRRATPRRGDVILTREAPLGEVGMIRTRDQVFLGQRLVLYRADPEMLDNRFLLAAFQSDYLQGQIKSLGSGATVEHMRLPDAEKLAIKLPPLTTQLRIGEILSAYDDLIENNTRRIKILEQIAHMICREWFVNFRFPGHERFKMVESEVGYIPMGWRAGLLREMCESIDYGHTASAVAEPIGPKFLRITDIVPDTIDWSSVPYCPQPDRNPQKYRLWEGDIVVARTGATTGYAKRLNKRHPESIFASYLVRLRLKPEHSNSMVGLIMESDEYKKFIKSNLGGAAQPQANAQVLASKPVAIPPSDLQAEFSAIVEPLLDEKEILQIKNANLRQTRDLLLPKLISGEVSVEYLEAEAASQVS